MSRETLVALIHDSETTRRITVSGRQVCRTLRALTRAGDNGITALELSSWALRLAHYVFLLRQHGLDIVTDHEPHEGGFHGRYRLVSSVTLDAESEAA